MHFFFTVNHHKKLWQYTRKAHLDFHNFASEPWLLQHFSPIFFPTCALNFLRFLFVLHFRIWFHTVLSSFMFSFSFDFRQQFRLKKIGRICARGLLRNPPWGLRIFWKEKRRKKKRFIVFILLGRHIYLVLNLWLEKEPSAFASLIKLLIIYLHL